MTDCSLCGLPTADSPVTDPAVEGEFCCQGCLHVSRTLDEVESVDTRSELADAVADEQSAAADAEATDVDGETVFLPIEGMHCATCELFLESRATDHEAVLAAAASYPAGLLKVVYDPEQIDRDQLPGIVDGLGYRVDEPRGSGPTSGSTESEVAGGASDETASDDSEYADHVDTSTRADATTGRLLVGAFFGMMAMCWYALFLYPDYLGLEFQLFELSGVAGQYLLWNLWLSASIVLGYTGAPLLRGAYVSLRTGLPNMDLLVALAAVTAHGYSTLVLLLGGTEVYFDVTIVIILAVTIGSAYEDRIRRRAAATLTGLTEERANVARRRTDNGVEQVPIEELDPDDRIVVREGERIPVDGTVVEGTGAVDESLVTGESVPVRREEGDPAVGGALVGEGGLVIAVDRGIESTADRLVELLWDVQTTRAGTQRLADRLAAVFVPLVFVLAALAASWHFFGGAGPTRTLLIGLSVLVVSCPCALGLATPLAISSGVRTALRDGVVITDGSAFERAPAIETVAFDKTGTLTTGSMRLLDYEGEPAALQRAAAVEQFADHPIATAVVEAAGDAPADSSTTGPVTDVTRYPGAGIGGQVDDRTVVVGRQSLFTERDWTVPDAYAERYAQARQNGAAPALVGWDGAVHGVLVAGDEPRPGWESVVSDLATDRRVVVISGDTQRAADRFRDHPAIDEVFAGVPPEAKAEIVERLQADGPVAMVGDGSNDAPALATADLGLSLERGTRLAADAADAVVTTDDLQAVPRTFELLDATRDRIRQNLGWALCYNAVAIPLAITGLLNPLFAAVAMAVSSLLVVVNSTRQLGSDSERAESGNRTSPTGSHEPERAAVNTVPADQ
jgi:Cu2+-exporting ATPase